MMNIASSEPLKTIVFGFEAKAPSIYINASMFTQIIRDHLLKKWVQSFLNESLQTAFPNNVLISKFHDECG